MRCLDGKCTGTELCIPRIVTCIVVPSLIDTSHTVIGLTQKIHLVTPSQIFPSSIALSSHHTKFTFYLSFWFSNLSDPVNHSHKSSSIRTSSLTSLILGSLPFTCPQHLLWLLTMPTPVTLCSNSGTSCSSHKNQDVCDQVAFKRFGL